MDLEKIKLPIEMVKTLENIFSIVKDKNPEITESLFIEYIISQWLEQFKIQEPFQPTNKDAVVLKNNLKNAIKYSDKNQRQISDEIGIKPAYLSQIIKGKYDPSIKLALLMLNSLNYPVIKTNELFYLEPVIAAE